MKRTIALLLTLALLTGCADNSAMSAKTAEYITAEAAETIEQTTAATMTTTLTTTTAATTTTPIEETFEPQEDMSSATHEALAEHPFARYLDNYTKEHGCAPYGVLIEDINGDGQDDMVVHINPFNNLQVVYINNGELKIVECGVMSVWGGTWYDRAANRIVNQFFFGHTEGTLGADEYYVYDWDGMDYVQTMHLKMEPGYYEREADGVTRTDNFICGKSYLNGEEITSERFEELQAELQTVMTADNLFDAVFSGSFETDEILKKEQEQHYFAYINEKLYAPDEEAAHYSPEILHMSDWNIAKEYYSSFYLPIIEQWQDRLMELHFDEQQSLFLCQLGDYVLLYTGNYYVKEPAAAIMSEDSFILLNSDFYYGEPYFFTYDDSLFVYDRYLQNGISHNTFDEYSLHSGDKVSSYSEFYDIGAELTEPDGSGFNVDYKSFADVAEVMDSMTDTLFRADVIENPFYSDRT